MDDVRLPCWRLALPVILIIVLGVLRVFAGAGFGLLPLLSVGVAIASASGGPRYTLGVGLFAIAECTVLIWDLPGLGGTFKADAATLLAIAAVTAVGIFISSTRERRALVLAEITAIADVAQQVLLRPVPASIRSVRLAVSYHSATPRAKIGGDFYDAAVQPGCIRLIIGDVQGKGIEGARITAAALGCWREAAYEEEQLAAIAARMEGSLERALGPEQFVTAVLAEFRDGEDKMDVLSCGHPPPLLLGSGGPRFADISPGLALGLAPFLPAASPGLPVPVPFSPGDAVLFYTDGLAEARDAAGEFFPLDGCAAVRGGDRREGLLEALAAELAAHTSGSLDDDLALLIACRAGQQGGFA